VRNLVVFEKKAKLIMKLQKVRSIAVVCILVFCFANAAFAKKHTVLIVLSHADDFMSIAPLIPKYAAEGHAVYYLALPGSQDSTEMVMGGKKFTQMQCATAALGFREATAFVDPNEGMRVSEMLRSVGWSARHIIEAIDRTKPDVVITWGPDGLTGHPRHIQVANTVTRVFQQQSLLEHKPRKLYYITYPESLVPDARIPLGVMAAGSDVSNEAGPFGTTTDGFITTVINAKDYLKQTRTALACLTFPKGNENKVWQEQWYERLAVTLGGKVFLRLVLPASDKRETDIFKGL
jgi:LmbE family N-acetylglucosaminyl deacetylase